MCPQTVSTRSSGREEPVVRMTHGGGLQDEQPCSREQSGAGQPSPLALSLCGRRCPRDVGRLCRKPSTGEGVYVPDKLCYSKAACLGSWLLQWVLVPTKCVLRCYWFQLERCLSHGVTLKDKPGSAQPPSLKQRRLRMS